MEINIIVHHTLERFHRNNIHSDIISKDKIDQSQSIIAKEQPHEEDR